MSEADFLCPECGSRRSDGKALIEHIPDDADPWTSVLKTARRASCRREIPAHLAARWDGISVEEARREWREVYRGRRRRYPPEA